MAIYQIKCEGVAPFTIDPAIAANDDLLKTMIAVSMPEVGNATITRHPEKDGVVLIEIVKRAGTKGCGYLEYLAECPGGINPAKALYQEIQTLNLAALTPEETLTLDGRIEQTLQDAETIGKAMESAIGRLGQSRCLASPLPALI